MRSPGSPDTMEMVEGHATFPWYHSAVIILRLRCMMGSLFVAQNPIITLGKPQVDIARIDRLDSSPVLVCPCSPGEMEYSETQDVVAQ